jgi:outer membrane protein assembly factor BamB
MLRSPVWLGGFVLGLTVLILTPQPAAALIEKPLPLEQVLKESLFVFTATVERVDPEKPAMVIEVNDNLKGKSPFAKMPVNLTGDADAKKFKHLPDLLKRVAAKLPLMIFVTKQDTTYIAFVYANGTWLQMTAQEADGDTKLVWSFTHCEPYLRRTFAGTTAELQQVVVDALAGKKKPPEYNPKEKPGFGPEIEEKKDKKEEEKSGAGVDAASSRIPAKRQDAASTAAGFSSGPPFAVIPSVAIGGVLSLLAMLFPTVFGGMTGQLKRWTAFLGVASLNSTLLFLHDWFGAQLQDSWWGTPTALWLSMTGVTLLGLLWACHRHATTLKTTGANTAATRAPTLRLAEETTGIAAAAMRPKMTSFTLVPSKRATVQESTPAESQRMELRMLGVLSGTGLLLFAGCLLWNLVHDNKEDQLQLHLLPWSFVLALWIGVWVGTLSVTMSRLLRTSDTRRALSSEGVILWATVPACIFLGLVTTPSVALANKVQIGTETGDASQLVSFLDMQTVFTPQGRGFIASQPLVVGDRVFTAVAHESAFRPYGKLYCVERSTGKVVWSFNDSGQMKQVFSSPCLADGKIYIGEGFHSDSRCKLYCLDAATGKKLWEYQTESHTESSPCVSDGKVYCGAGEEGLLCLDAGTGQKVWQYSNGLHVDASPAIVGKRVFCGSGVDRDKEEGKQGETAIFCLDAETGNELWKVTVDLPVWGSPCAFGDQVFYGLGNGDALTSAPNPAGAVLCATADGRQLWRCDVPDGVLERPAVDRGRVYFGCRDGNCYCVGRHDGQVRWKAPLGSAVVASPALARDPESGMTLSVYAVGCRGNVACLDARTGATLWSPDLAGTTLFLISTPVVVTDGPPEDHRRIVYVGAGMNDNAFVGLLRFTDRWKE